MDKSAKLRIGKFSASAEDISFLLFIAGGIAGLVQLLHPLAFGAGYEMVAIARNVAEHGAFANPFYIANTGPTAVEPPLYPLFLAALMGLLKRQFLVVFAVAIANICANSLVAAWLPRISLLFYDDIMPGVVGGVLWLCAAQLLPSWDASFTVAGLLLFCLLSASSIRRTDNAAVFGGAIGLLAGLLFLLNNSSILVSLPWIVYLLVRRAVPLKRVIAYFCPLLAIFCVIVSVWVLRNRRELGSPVLRTNLGMTLYVSNNDCAEASLIDDERRRCYQTHHPNVSASEASLLQSLGEVRYDRQRTADARSWILAHPIRFLQLTLTRFGQFWFPSADQHPFSAYAIWLITALSIPGLILMVRRREPTIPFMLAVLALYPLMYYVVVSDVRYRYPVLWISILSAGYCVHLLADLARPRTSRSLRSRSDLCDQVSTGTALPS